MPGFIGVGYSEYVDAPASVVPGPVYLLSTGGLHVRDGAIGTWSLVADASTVSGGGTSCSAFDVFPSNPILVAVSDTVIRRSINGGVSWSTLNNPVANADDREYDYVVFGSNSSTIYVWNGIATDGSQAGIWKTTNGGTTWTKIVGGADFTNPNGGIGVGIGQVHVGPFKMYYTVFKDVGGAWRYIHRANIDGSTIETYAPEPANLDATTLRSTRVHGDYDSIYAWESGSGASIAGAKIWRVQGEDITDVTPAAEPVTDTDYYTSVLGNDSGVVLAVYRKPSAGLGNSRTYRSINFGSSWSEITALQNLVDSTFSNTENVKVAHSLTNHGEWWIPAEVANTVYHTEDTGLTWETESVPSLPAGGTRMMLGA